MMTDPASTLPAPTHAVQASPTYTQKSQVDYLYPTRHPALQRQHMSDTNNLGPLIAIFTSVFMMTIWALVMIPIALFSIIGLWKVFSKAGQPGWASIIPIYNWYIKIKIAGRPGWWLLLFFVPFANIVVSIIVAMDIASAFNKDAVFGVVGLWLFPVIGYFVLGFSKDKYLGVPKHEN